MISNWRRNEISTALKKCQAIVDKANGEQSICGLSRESCEELRLYVQSWIIPPLEKALKNKRFDSE